MTEYLKILKCRAWVHILKKKRFKVDERTWQNILIDYDVINQYHILDSRIEKIHVTRDVSFDENNIYDRKELRIVDCDDEKWTFNDDEFFIDLANLIVVSNNSDDDENSWYRFVSRSNFRVSRDQYATSSNTSSMRADDDNFDIDDDDDSLLDDLKIMKYVKSSETHRFRQQNQRKQVFDDVDVDVDENDDIISLRNVNTSFRRFRKEKSIFTSESSLSRRSERHNVDQFNKSKNYYYSKFDEQTYFKINEKRDFVRSKSNIKTNFIRKVMYTKTIFKSYIHMIIVLAMLIVVADIIDIDESLTLKQTKVSSHWFEFQKIMKREFDFFIENEIWDLTFASFSQSILIDRWVFKIKKDRWDNILKFKTRWVVHEFKQKKELDFIDIFVFVVKSMFWKVMMTIFAKRDYRIRQMNVIIAFLYEFLDEKMYVRQSTRMKDETSRICLLKKIFYDLKQSFRVWYQTLVICWVSDKMIWCQDELDDLTQMRLVMI